MKENILNGKENGKNFNSENNNLYDDFLKNISDSEYVKNDLSQKYNTGIKVN